MIEQSNMIKHPAYGSAVAIRGGVERTLLLLISARDAEETAAKRRMEEDAAIDAESILEQAEEANALDPVG